MSESFRAFVATQNGDAVDRAVTSLALDELPSDGALIAVEYSSVNYKDGLATIPKGRVARISPLIPGIDLAGTVIDGGDTGLPAGTPVLAHGYAIGVGRHGGFAERARVPGDWIVPIPPGLTAREAMVIGTAGFTAAMSVAALEDHGLQPGHGPVLVTGATGGVGSAAVAMLAGRGYEVVASTGKASSHEFLRGLGASSIIDRSELAEGAAKPLEKEIWAGAVDCVGGSTLANLIPKLKYGGAVAASGLTGGAAVPTTVMPFILRGVSLLGIDSVELNIARRREIWVRLGRDLKPAGLADIGHDVSLDGLTAALDSVLAGATTGRAVVDLAL
ncbi:MAG: acryloyl-CoA reductase [Acidimicrobiia bacterium]